MLVYIPVVGIHSSSMSCLVGWYPSAVILSKCERKYEQEEAEGEEGEEESPPVEDEGT